MPPAMRRSGSKARVSPRLYRIVMARKCDFYDKQDTVLGAMTVIRDAHLLDIGQMTALFPDAIIHKERFLGWVNR